MERPTPPWINEIPEGAFVSYDPTYPTGKYFNRFKKDEAFGLKYYRRYFWFIISRLWYRDFRLL